MSTERKPFPSETQDRFIVRFPEGMRERIRLMANDYGRSMNAQIVFMLQEYFDRLDTEVNELQAATARTEDQTADLLNPKIQKAIDSAAEMSAQKTTERMLRGLASLSPEALKEYHDRGSYLDYALSVILGKALDSEDTPATRKSATPSIPGVNAPKRGLGAPPKPEKPKRERVQTTKKKVFVKTDNTTDDHS